MENVDFDNDDLDNLIIKDKDYYAKRRKKYLLILIPILSVIIIAIVLIVVLRPKKDNKIICRYETEIDNENVTLINIDDNIEFIAIIDDVKYNNKKSHIFPKARNYTVIFDFAKKLNSLKSFFEGNEYLLEADFTKMQTENIKSMENLFKDCIYLTNVTFDNKTPDLENTRNMFFRCSSLKEVKTNFDTSKVERMDYMFYSCESLTSLDLSYFNFENLKNSDGMFTDCINLKKIIFNNNTLTKNLESMERMFDGCKSLETINTKIFRENKLRNLNFVFNSCTSLKEIDLSYFETTYMTELQSTFQNCKSLEKINFAYFDTSKLKSITNIFNGCQNLKALDISMFNMDDLIDASFAFSDCQSLISVNLPEQMKSLESTNNMFKNCFNLTNINLGFLKGASRWKSSISMFDNCISLNETNFPFVDAILLKNTSRMFLGCSNLKSINLYELNAGNINCMNFMFSGCKNLMYLNIYRFDTRNEPDCFNIFKGVPENITIINDRLKTGVRIKKEIDNITKIHVNLLLF